MHAGNCYLYRNDLTTSDDVETTDSELWMNTTSLLLSSTHAEYEYSITSHATLVCFQQC
jgi:hypothetical protein